MYAGGLPELELLDCRLGPIVFVTPELGKWSTVGGLGVMVDELTVRARAAVCLAHTVVTCFLVGWSGGAWCRCNRDFAVLSQGQEGAGACAALRCDMLKRVDVSFQTDYLAADGIMYSGKSVKVWVGTELVEMGVHIGARAVVFLLKRK